MTFPAPTNAAAAYGLGAPTEADLVALLTKTAGADASAMVARARATVQPGPGVLSLDALERVARAIVASGTFPNTISARSFLVRLGSYRALHSKAVPPSTTVRPTAA